MSSDLNQSPTVDAGAPVEVLVVVETRDHEHRASVLAELRDRGFDAQLVE